ncbi:MAG: RsmE family RNA methyltransferase [Deltaproteobacteria bacterium]|nr:RsmE family RNA methyltransferase [Deltaproteobacteria bacterium]
MDESGEVLLRGRRALHLRKVLKVEAGQRVRAGLLGGPLGAGWIVALEGEGVRLRFEAEGEAPAPPELSLVLALPRPKVLSRVLQAAASFGLRRIDLVNAWKVEKSYFDSPRLAPARLREDLIAGCEQGAHTWLPELAVHRRFLGYLEGLPPPGGEARVFAQIGSARSLGAVLPAAGAVSLLVGPEGGLLASEEESLHEAGFRGFALGTPVLAVPVAVAVALGQVALLRGPGSVPEPGSRAIL